MSLQIQLNARPAILPLYFRALTARKRRQVSGGGEAVLATVRLQQQAIDAAHLQEYREVCGFGGAASVPATYPFVLAMPLHLKLLVSDAFPFPVLGVVHVRNQITQYRKLQESDRLEIQCELGAPAAVKRGYEFDLVTRVYVSGELVWEGVSTLLARTAHRSPVRSVRAVAERSDFEASTAIDWQVPADIGRRYARVSGDRNPIHLFASTAKIFGFTRAIAHGMWLKAHCLAALEATAPADPLFDRFRFSVEFKKPVLLPSQVSLLHARDDDFLQFSLTGEDTRRAHLCGRIEAI
ncbi:MaoC/PaaZ C-terminal domain-containing protein [Microbulbifer mangrovi]|uniref:MaoC/PaaZ C-terminal domain-containing protein n=1 Tax=Microbulbifer mangrovi TaxID=927787 RepID=UPI0013011588|nr:MaoC/PaaZ C-terminal domain-containing protein [Microbulbifer mangrovi]